MRGFCCIGLDNPKYSSNVGSVLRAAGIFDASMVALSGLRYQRSNTDTMKAYRHLPLIQTDELRKVIPFDCIPVAVDILPNARPLNKYAHPERAFYIFGAEDSTLDRKTTDWCRDVIYIPSLR
jgi:tRNA(Leu) C34 or U34 (ribose-2'-O)-methylase TrmL